MWEKIIDRFILENSFKNVYVDKNVYADKIVYADKNLQFADNIARSQGLHNYSLPPVLNLEII